MATYQVNKFDGTLLVQIPELEINTTATPLKLLGKKVVDYGEIIAENFVYLMENFSSTTPPYPPLVGMIWFDLSNQVLKIFTSSGWTIVNKNNQVINQSAIPLTAEIGQLWFNSTNNILKLFDGTAWITVYQPGIIPVRNINPDSPLEGQIYYNIEEQAIYVWTNIRWVKLLSDNQGIINYTDTFPGDSKAGAVIFNTITNTLYIWDGSRWNPINSVQVSPNVPNYPYVGQTWYDINTETLKVHTGINWITIGPTLENNSVTSSTIAPGAIEEINLANNAVTGSKIKPETIPLTALEPSLQTTILYNYPSTLTPISGNITGNINLSDGKFSLNSPDLSGLYIPVSGGNITSTTGLTISSASAEFSGSKIGYTGGAYIDSTGIYLGISGSTFSLNGTTLRYTLSGSSEFQINYNKFKWQNNIGAFLESDSEFKWGIGSDNKVRFSQTGNVYCDGQLYAGSGTAVQSGSADFAEYMESITGDKLPIGETVVVVDGKIDLASKYPGKKIIGVIRPKHAALIVGNSTLPNENKYITNEFGERLVDNDGNYIINELYSDNFNIHNKENLPEWNIVGFVGQIPIKVGQPINSNWIFIKKISNNANLYLVK